MPGLAESWEVSDDGLTWTFKLKEGVKFHNGSELTASDVARSASSRRMFVFAWLRTICSRAAASSSSQATPAGCARGATVPRICTSAERSRGAQDAAGRPRAVRRTRCSANRQAWTVTVHAAQPATSWNDSNPAPARWPARRMVR